MKCFYHNVIDAVAICKNCSRGICQDCAAELLNGVACKNRCEDEVEAVNRLINRNKTAYQKTSSAYSRNALIFLLLGILFLAFGGIHISSNSSFGWFLILGGSIFLIGALLYFSIGKKYSQKDMEINNS
jgi:hypothetical protein